MAWKFELDKTNFVYRIHGIYILIENWNGNLIDIGIKNHEKVWELHYLIVCLEKPMQESYVKSYNPPSRNSFTNLV
jgi:hypothetical protein